MNALRSRRSAVLPALLLAALAASLVAAPAFAQKEQGAAAIGFMAISPNLSDAASGAGVADLLYGATVKYRIRPWFEVGTEVLYLGDAYYGPGAASFAQGPSSWSSLVAAGGTGGTARADWKYYETMLYAPLSLNLVAPLGIVRPYLGAGPAFYFHLPSTNETPAFTAYLQDRYGASGVLKRIGTGLTARAGLDILVADSFSVGVGYLLREDLPANLFGDLADPAFYRENGYIFLSGRVVVR